MSNINVTIRMDEELKSQAEELFSDLGFSLSTAITMFVKKAIAEQGIPFSVTRKVPNRTTMDAFDEVRRMKADASIGKTYSDVRSMMEDILT